MDKIIKLHDNKNFDFYFKKYWNGFVDSDTPKIHFSLEDFFDKMNNEKFIRMAIDKMEYQDRIVSCQYIKRSKAEHGFANFFLMKLPEKYKICNGASYYFIYKNDLNRIENLEDDFFMPKRNVYTDFKIDPDSLDYLAVNKKDFIYCLKYKKVIKYDEIFNKNIINF